MIFFYHTRFYGLYDLKKLFDTNHKCPIFYDHNILIFLVDIRKEGYFIFDLDQTQIYLKNQQPN